MLIFWFQKIEENIKPSNGSLKKVVTRLFPPEDAKTAGYANKAANVTD